MTSPIVDRLVQALLYEGYILYPYRPSVKNRKRWTIGGLYPRGYSEADGNGDPQAMQTECLVTGRQPVISVSVRFLHLMDRLVGKLREPARELRAEGEPDFDVVESLEVGGRLHQTWQEAVERTVSIGNVDVTELVARPRRQEFAFPALRATETLCDPNGDVRAVLVRNQQAVAGAIALSAAQIAEEVFRLTIVAVNESSLADPERTSRDEAILATLASAHTILHVERGEFVSLLEPPDELQSAAAECSNLRTWPVLAGQPGETDTLLSSPIILYDYPQVAPESPGDLFDGTEIDEILTLRIMTLTDEEKRVAKAVDERARALLQRTESLGPGQLRQLHGALRGAHALDLKEKP